LALIAQSQAALARSQDMDAKAAGNRGQSARLASEAANTLAFLAVAAGFARTTAEGDSSSAVKAQLEALVNGFTLLSRTVDDLRTMIASGQAQDSAAQAELRTAIAAETAARQAAGDVERQRALLAEQMATAASATVRQDLQVALAAMSVRTAALENRMPAVASGRAATATSVSLGAGATYAVNVGFDAPAPSADYTALPVIDSPSVPLFGALDVVSVSNRTTTGCTVTVKNTSLLSLGGVITVTVIALKL
jgi:hypothetical protein